MPVGSNCCDTTGNYCLASEPCGTQGGSLVCLTNTQAATASSNPTTQARTSAGGVKTSSSPSPSSLTATTAVSISIKGSTSASQAAVSFSTSIQKSFWSVGGDFAVIVTVLLS